MPPVRLVYTEMVPLADGSETPVQREIDLPDGRVIAQNLACYGPAYFPLEGRTIPAGGYWHWEPTAAAESARLRVLGADELKAGTKRGRFVTGAVEQADPVTGIGLEDLQQADGPIPQVALPEEEA